MELERSSCRASAARVVLGSLASFAVSVFTFHQLHRKGVPELARYGVGGLTILMGEWIVCGDRAALQAFLGVSVAGVGVSLNRLRLALSEDVALD